MSGLRGTNVEKSNVHAVPNSWHRGSAQLMAEMLFLVCSFVLKVRCLEPVPSFSSASFTFWKAGSCRCAQSPLSALTLHSCEVQVIPTPRDQKWIQWALLPGQIHSSFSFYSSWRLLLFLTIPFSGSWPLCSGFSWLSGSRRRGGQGSEQPASFNAVCISLLRFAGTGPSQERSPSFMYRSQL